MTGRYPGLDPVTTLVQERSDAALKAALAAGYSDTDAWRVADRARAEARAGVRNSTSSFAGSVVEGTGPVTIRSYTGNHINPLGDGLANASTQD